MDTLQAIIIAIVEGLTEYLPISSTAHMIFTQQIMGIPDDNFFKIFALCIQFGAILAVVFLYWRKFFDFSKWQFYVKLAFAVIPALILGYLFDDYIDNVLEKPIPISIVLIVGGIILLFIDKFFKNPVVFKEKEISIKSAIIIGFWQCLAMMPGTSRSAASIIGGMQQKLCREVAAEFSFFLAVPTMLAVTVYSIFSSSEHTILFILGNIIAFIVAIIAIKSFVNLIKKYGFKPWGFYRIFAGIVLLIYFSVKN